jgi:hypothetical protein
METLPESNIKQMQPITVCSVVGCANELVTPTSFVSIYYIYQLSSSASKFCQDASIVRCAGHGIMWDGAVNNELTSLLESALEGGAIVATCGHGAVALLEVKTKHNTTVDYFVKNKEAKPPLLSHSLYLSQVL